MTAVKFYKKYALITLLLLRLLNEVQGKTTRRSNNGKCTRNEEQENISLQNRGFFNNFEKNSYKNEYLHKHSLITEMQDCLVQQNSVKKATETSEISKGLFTHEKIKEERKSYRKKFRLKTAKSPLGVIKLIKTSYQKAKAKDPINSNTRSHRSFPTQKIYCRQIRKYEINSQGDVVENVHLICAPPTAASVTPIPIPAYATTKRNFGNLVTSTPKGINCRRVMNSEFNDLGEIVDSVLEVCDPPPTTTTTTRRPIITTTPQITTTTPKPLVKVCRPVMDSYLNDEGQIIDSVTTVCKMEQVTQGK